MKIRSGFVSNSSTSSFVILGYKLTAKLQKHLIEVGVVPPKDKWVDKEGGKYTTISEFMLWGDGFDLPELLYIEEGYGDDDTPMIGINLDETCMKFDKIAKNVQKMKEILKTEEEPKLFNGVSAC